MFSRIFDNEMIKLTILSILTLLTFELYAQKSKHDMSYNSCTGAINIFENGDFKLQFTGKENNVDFISSYPSLNEIEKTNQVWCSYIAGTAGTLKFKANTDQDFLQMVIFTQEVDDICGELLSGVAEIKRLQKSREFNEVGLDSIVNGGYMYTLKLRQGEKIQILFTTAEEKKNTINLNWNFSPEIIVEQKSKIVDKRNDDFAPTFSIILRDDETKIPIVGSVEIVDSKQVDGVYRASDLFFNLKRKCEISLLCNVDGYFFDERIIEVNPFEDQEVIVLMSRISSGKSIKIEDIQFKPGTSEIVPSSEPKLNRLKDFLALNSELNIEIQGHVFEIGENSDMGQKISEARAKRIMKYLIEHGIDKKRLDAVGYGNTRPVFEEPKLFAEEQANRRVEILIK